MPDFSRWREVFRNPFAKRPHVVSASDVIARGRPLPKEAVPGDLVGPPSHTGAPPTVLAPPTDTEHGVSGTTVFGGVLEGDEYNPDLKGLKGLNKFDEMRRSDAQVGASLQVVKLPLLAARWQAVPPEKGDQVDQGIADSINEYLVDDDALRDPWPAVLKHILSQLEFGFSVLESVWYVEKDFTWRLRRLAPRLAKTIKYWHLTRDGRIVRIWQYAAVTDDKVYPVTNRVPIPPRAAYQWLPIPGNVANVFTFNKEGDLYTGTSVLRAAYRNWFYKDLYYHLDGMRIDRFGVGIPIAELQENHGLSDDDIDGIEELLQALRANERAYLIAPPGVKFRIMGPEGRGGAAADSVPMVDHHDSQIARNVLASFLTAGRDARGLGAGSQTNRLADLFVSALVGMANQIAGDMKKQIIKPLCDLNFDMTGREYPSIVVRDLESSDVERMSKTLFGAVGEGLITPDDDLEAILRKTLRLPPLPQELSRKAAREAEDEALETATKQELEVEGFDPMDEKAPVKMQRKRMARDIRLARQGIKLPGKPQPGLHKAGPQPKE